MAKVKTMGKFAQIVDLLKKDGATIESVCSDNAKEIEKRIGVSRTYELKSNVRLLQLVAVAIFENQYGRKPTREEVGDE